MATNLVSLVMDVLTPDIIARIAAALGLDRGTGQKAIGAAVPALLAAFAGAAAKPGGAGRLFDAVDQQGSGVLTNLAKTLDGSGPTALAERGSGLLASLLGGSTQSELANAVGKFAGISEGKSSSLLGILGPIAMGALRKQQTASDLDASGLANLLASQGSNISAALPSGFANLLAGTDVLDSLGSRATATTTAAAQATTTAAARRVVDTSSPRNWLIWVIPLIALLALAWYFLTPRAPETPTPTATTTEPTTGTTTRIQPATGTAANLTVDGVDLGASVTSALDGLKASLGSITDATTAQAALPKLQEATSALEKVNGKAGKLDTEQKSALAALITAALPVINPLIDKVLAIPVVSDILKPAVDGLRAQLDALAKA